MTSSFWLEPTRNLILICCVLFLGVTRANAVTSPQDFEEFLDTLDLDLAIDIGDTPAWKQQLINNPRLQADLTRVGDKTQQRGIMRQFGDPTPSTGADAAATEARIKEIRSLLEAKKGQLDPQAREQIRRELAQKYDPQTLRKFRQKMLREAEDFFPPLLPDHSGFVRRPVTPPQAWPAFAAVMGLSGGIGFVAAKVLTKSWATAAFFGAVGALSSVFYAGVAGGYVTKRMANRLQEMADVVKNPADLATARLAGTEGQPAVPASPAAPAGPVVAPIAHRVGNGPEADEFETLRATATP